MSSKFCRVTLHETAETTAQDTAAAIDAYLDKVRPQSAARLLYRAESGASSLLAHCCIWQ